MKTKKEEHLTTLKEFHAIDARTIEAVGEVKSDAVRAFLVASKIAFTETYLSIIGKMVEDPTQFEGMTFNNILRSSLKEQLHKDKT